MTTSKSKERQAGGRLSSPRDLPQVDELVGRVLSIPALSGIPRAILTQFARESLESARGKLVETGGASITVSTLEKTLLKLAQRYKRRSPMRVINGAGALLHTNLGRAPFTEEFLRQALHSLSGYSNLEFDLSAGKRGKRGEFVTEQLTQLTGASDALVVNNCAGALFLALNTVSQRKETIVSRGELVQIGGGFRVPDIMRRAGAKLVEVGTTNITQISDYNAAITDKTGLVLKVSLSNFSQSGFVDSALVSELAELAHQRDLPLLYDLGSGLVADPSKVNLKGEVSIQSALKAGADIVCASGDKLLGGPQAGLILGKSEYLAKMRKNPIYRTLRPDKLTLTLLSEILKLYQDGTWESEIPLWSLSKRSESELYEFGRKIIEEVDGSAVLTLEATTARYGGGSTPDVEIPSCAIGFNTELSPEKCSPTRLARLFRELPVPIIGRIEDDRFLLDLRAILPEDEALFIDGLRAVLASL